MLRAKTADGELKIAAKKVLVTVGRRPVVAECGAADLGLDMQGRYIKINGKCQTSMRGVYAIGDVTGEPMLAHRAMAQGEIAAAVIAGEAVDWDKRAIPAVCFTDPEIVVVGQLPEEARTVNAEAAVATYPLRANGRAMTLERTDGFVRIVHEKSDGLVLGIQAVGAGVSEFAGEFALALEMCATLTDIAATIHAHPTLGETVQEAAMAGWAGDCTLRCGMRRRPMDFSLTEEQAAIREMAEAFAQDEVAPQAIEWDQAKHFPVDVLKSAMALGLGGIMVSDAHGGSGLGRVEAVLVYEALAKGCPAFSAYVSIHNMVASMIDKHGSEVQKSAYLPRLCTGELLASYCLTEPSCGSDAAALTTRAERDGDDYLLTGQKMFISGAGATDLYVVMARTGGPGAKGVLPFWWRRMQPVSPSVPMKRKWAGMRSRPARSCSIRCG